MKAYLQKGSLYNPGPNPAGNTPFMFFLAAFVRACNLHSDLLRATIAVPGNEYRLGGMEAPPGITTVYTGQDLQAVRTLYLLFFKRFRLLMTFLLENQQRTELVRRPLILELPKFP